MTTTAAIQENLNKPLDVRSEREATTKIDQMVKNVGTADISMAPAVVVLNRNGRAVSMNKCAEALTGFSTEECIETGLEIFHRETSGEISTFLGLLRRTAQVGSLQCELTIVHRNGTVIPVSVWISLLDGGTDQIEAPFVAVFKSAHAPVPIPLGKFLSNEANDAARRIILALVADAILIADFDGMITYLNPAAERLTGWSCGEAIGRPEREVLCIVDGTGSELYATNQHFQGDSDHELLQSRHGVQHDISLIVTPILDSSNTIVGTVSIFRDITATRKTEEALKRHVTSDQLTSLANRYEFERQLGGLCERLHGEDHHALLYIDLDQFKVINETCGHSAGDELLRQLSQVLITKVRTSDLVARLGGDEFAIILRNCAIVDAQRTAQQLLWAIESFIFEWNEKKFKLTASIGVGGLTAGQNAVTALSIVDRACQFAKDQGRNRIYVYQENDRDLSKRLRQMGWIPRIQDAVAQDRFRLYFQPIVSLGQNIPSQPAHYEVLLRLVDEQDRLVLPGAFIPAAERYQQMALIDRWVIQAALKTVSEFPQENSAFSLNLSGQTVGRDDFLNFLLEEIGRSKIDPRRLCFEITESAAIDNFDRAIRLFSSLKQRGCQIALDDFGIGISSLSYLKRLNVDLLKIDGSFIRGITKTPTDFALVKAIQQVAKSLGILTVAECIEDIDTMNMVRDLEVNFGQGYFIGMPGPIDDFRNFAAHSLIPNSNAKTLSA